MDVKGSSKKGAQYISRVRGFTATPPVMSPMNGSGGGRREELPLRQLDQRTYLEII